MSNMEKKYFGEDRELIEEMLGEEITAKFYDAENADSQNIENTENINDTQNNEENFSLENSTNLNEDSSKNSSSIDGEFVPTGESLEMSELTDSEEDLKPKKKRKLSFLVDGSLFAFLMVFGIALVSSIFVFQVWLTPIKVVGVSMQPSINLSVVSDRDEDHCDVVYYNKNKSYKNNDVVIVENTNQKYVQDKSVEYLIKRVVACPGQKIRFFLIDNPTSVEQSDRLYYDIRVFDKDGKDINLDQSYLDEEMFFFVDKDEHGTKHPKHYSYYYYNLFSELILTETDETKFVERTLGENEYYVMGDNRNGSQDSRFFGAVSYNDIAGSVKITVAYGENIFVAIWDKFKSIF